MIGELMAGARSAGVAAADVAVYVDELEALRGELSALSGAPDAPHVIVEMCHEQRPEVRSYLLEIGFSEVTDPTTLERFRR